MKKIILRSAFDRERAAKLIAVAPEETRVIFMDEERTDDQNKKMWALLGEVAKQLEWCDQKLSPEDWKIIFMVALAAFYKEEVRVVPNIDRTGYVNLTRSSSNLSKKEMADLIEIIQMFCANHGVALRDDPLPMIEHKR